MSLADILAKRKSTQTPTTANPNTGPGAPDVSASSAAPVPSAPPSPEPVPQVVPPDAPASDPAKAAEPLPTEKPPEPEKPKRGRKPKTETPATTVNESTPETPADAPKPDVADTLIADVQKTLDAGAPPKLELFVDCVSSRPGVSLAPYIAEKLATFAKAFPDLLDIRCAPKKTADGKDHTLAFGAWKGVLAAECRMNPPAPGRYFVLGVSQSEIAQVVVEALEPLCSEFTKGVR